MPEIKDNEQKGFLVKNLGKEVFNQGTKRTPFYVLFEMHNKKLKKK